MMHFSLRREGAMERFCASSMTTTTKNETTTTVCSSSSSLTTREIRTDDARRWRGRMTQRACEPNRGTREDGWDKGLPGGGLLAVKNEKRAFEMDWVNSKLI